MTSEYVQEVSDLELERAAREGDVALLERVTVARLSGFKHSNGSSGLLLDEAIAHGQAGVVRCLVQRSLESGVSFVWGWTLGHVVAFEGDVEALDELSEEELHATSDTGSTLMYAAALGGHVVVIDWLVELGVDPKATRNDGWTAIHSAAQGGHVAVIDRCIELGVDPKAKMNNGWTAIHSAAQGGHVAVIDRLVELGADPKATKNNGWTAIHSAAQEGHVAVIDRLVGLGVDPKATRNDGWTAIHSAAQEGHVAVIDRLVELGVDPKAKTNNGWTAIHVAAQEGHADTIAYLLELGVDPKATTHRFFAETALDVAQRNNRSAAASLLRGETGWVIRTSKSKWPKFVDSEAVPDPPAALISLRAVALSAAHVGHVLSAWPRLQSLQSLDLRGLDSGGFEKLAFRLGDLSELHDLRLAAEPADAWQHATAASLDAIAVPPLHTLSLSYLHFEDATSLSNCDSLVSLTLSSCSLSRADLYTVAALSRLERLVLAGSRFVQLDPLGAGCLALSYLDVRDCELAIAPTFLTSLPALQQLLVADNPFVYQLQEYGALLSDPEAALDFLRTLLLSSKSKSRDVPVVMVGHGRAGKSQVLRSLLQEASWLGVIPGYVERVAQVEERTSMVGAGIHSLALSTAREADEFETRFFDTPGQMEFFASNLIVLAPLFSSSVVLCVARCVSHGASEVRVRDERRRIAREFRLWLAEVSRAVLQNQSGSPEVAQEQRDHGVAGSSKAVVLLVLTHRDVLQAAKGDSAVAEMETWLASLTGRLRAEFADTLDVRGGIELVDATLRGERGHGVGPVRARLVDAARGAFAKKPLMPDLLVEVRAFVQHTTVRRHRIIKREALNELLLSRFGARGLTPRLLQLLMDALEKNGTVLCTPGRQLVVVYPSWLSQVMASLYVDPRLWDMTDVIGVDVAQFDALESFDEAGEVLAPELEEHLRQFVAGDEALLGRLMSVMVSTGVAIPLRVSERANHPPFVESYLIVGRWMSNGAAADDKCAVQWTSTRGNDTPWFDLVTRSAYSPEAAARKFDLLRRSTGDNAAYRLVSLRCMSRVPIGVSLLTWLVHRLATLCRSGQHSFTVRRTAFACVLPASRFAAAVHVQLAASGRGFDVTVVAAPNDAFDALSLVMLEVVFPVLEKLVLEPGQQLLGVVQRCGGCVATSKELQSDKTHDRRLASGERVSGTEQCVRALCAEALGEDGKNYRHELCCGYGGVLNLDQGADAVRSADRSQSVSSFVLDIPRASIELNESRVLGRGQFGSVMEGMYNGAEVVLKELKVCSSAALAEVQREAELLGRASRHPRISLLLGLCRLGESRVCMVMERAGVCDLEKALCKQVEKPLLGAKWDEFGVLVGLLKDVALALRHLHSQNPPIVHNDVALRNVLVRRESGCNRAKLTDLGLARVVERGRVLKLARGTRVPKWQLAPETLESRVVSPSSDVFQFGNLVFEMVARQRPFAERWSDAHSRASVETDIKGSARPSWEAVRAAGAHCPSWLRELAAECWRADPSRRPAMEQVSEVLAARVEKEGGLPREQARLGASVPGAGVGATAVGAAVEEDDDGNDEEQAKQPDEEDDAAPAPTTQGVKSWTVDDVCTWLLQLGIPSVIELAPLFQHHGVDGELLLELDFAALEQLGVPWLTARALFRARDMQLHSAY